MLEIFGYRKWVRPHQEDGSITVHVLAVTSTFLCFYHHQTFTATWNMAGIFAEKLQMRGN